MDVRARGNLRFPISYSNSDLTIGYEPTFDFNSLYISYSISGFGFKSASAVFVCD